ncbi:hypothetical protein LCGC14_3055400 [marine sediment metagenome]|uniref:Uncharacterized protein n=1 Tax=marine sediment metagenome TaxID=412755 RepID=A0A0F8YTA9_9ZZZZ
MRRYIIIAVLLLAAPVLAFQEEEYGYYNNEPDGFRGIKWGDALPDGMAKIGTEASFGGIDIYIRKGDKLTIGGAELEQVAYYFWRGKFISSAINTKDSGNWNALMDALKAKFGKGTQNNPYIEKYYWPGAKTNIYANYNEFSKEGSITFISLDHYKKMQAYAEQKAKEGAEDGF